MSGGRGALAEWAAHSPSAPGRQGGRQGFHLIIATPRYPGQLCETDEMSTSELPAAFLHCCCEMKGRSHVIIPWNKSCRHWSDTRPDTSSQSVLTATGDEQGDNIQWPAPLPRLLIHAGSSDREFGWSEYRLSLPLVPECGIVSS